MIENIYFLTSVCDNVPILKVILFIKVLLKAVLFIIPMGLIIMVSFDFFKNVIANKEDEMKKNQALAIKRLLFAVVLFLIPNIVEFAIGSFAGAGTEYQACLNITSEVIEEKLELAKAQCAGDDYEWNDTLGMCVKKEKFTTDKANITGSDANYTVTGSSGSNTTSNANAPDNLTYYNQGDYSHVPFCDSEKSVTSSGCGATSLAVIATSFSSAEYDPEYVANWLCSNGHGGGALYTDWFDSDKLTDKFNLNAEQLFDSGSAVYQANAGKEYNEKKGNAILNAIKSGKGVILYIPGHYVAVGNNAECSSEQVYLYEVGNRSKCGCYTIKELWDTTYNNKDKCKNNGNCGWKAAWAYTGR